MATSPDTRRLMDLARGFAATTAYPDLVCAYAGGSVGRGVADRFSDLDLMFWHRQSPSGPSAANIEYDGEIIQVHHDQTPSAAQLEARPWDNRFIRDAAPVHDPGGTFAQLHRSFLAFLDLPQGRSRIVDQALAVVQARRNWTRACLDRGHFHTGGMAAMAAWVDAAFLLGYLSRGSTSTGDPLANLADHPDLRGQIAANCPVPPLDGPGALEERGRAVRAYRRYLAGRLQHPFALDELQDDLLWRKVSRLRQRLDPVRSAHELYHQTYWLVLLAYAGSLEDHLRDLPPDLAKAMQGLGFASVDKAQIENLLAVSRQLTDLAVLTT